MDKRSKLTIFTDNICISAFQHFCSVSWTKEQKAMAFDQFVLEQFFDWNCQWHWYLSVWQDIKGDFKPTNCLVNQKILMLWSKMFFFVKLSKGHLLFCYMSSLFMSPCNTCPEVIMPHKYPNLNIRGKIEYAPIIFENQFPLVFQYFAWRDGPIIIHTCQNSVLPEKGLFRIKVLF